MEYKTNMTNIPTKLIVNAIDGIETIVELEGDELIDYLAKKEEFELAKINEPIIQLEKDAARTALLTRLGITEEEAALLLGGTN